MKKILQTLAHKWPEYFLEILVITIGIYGAFAVENWNDDRKERQEEQVLLAQLKNEYEGNLAQLDNKIATRNAIIKSSKELLHFFDKPTGVSYDSIIEKLANLGLTVTFDPVSNDLVGSGKINIIQNQQLKELLTRWSTDVIQVQEVEVIYFNRYQTYSLPVLIGLGIGRSLDETFWKSVQSLDFMLSKNEIKTYDYGESRFAATAEQLLNNVELEGIISNSIMVNDFINLEAITLRKQIVQILDILNKEIK